MSDKGKIPMFTTWTLADGRHFQALLGCLFLCFQKNMFPCYNYHLDVDVDAIYKLESGNHSNFDITWNNIRADCGKLCTAQRLCVCLWPVLTAVFILLIHLSITSVSVSALFCCWLNVIATVILLLSLFLSSLLHSHAVIANLQGCRSLCNPKWPFQGATLCFRLFWLRNKSLRRFRQKSCIFGKLCSLNLYNRAGECKVGMTRRVTVATFKGNMPGGNLTSISLWYNIDKIFL